MKKRWMVFTLSLLLAGLSACLSANPSQPGGSAPTGSSATPAPAEPAAPPTTPATIPAATPDASAYRDIAFVFNGEPVVLKNGVSEMEAAPGSASKIVTRYFGSEAFGDLNSDGREDVAFLLTQTGGGSGTFYFVVAALRAEMGYTGSNAVLLGDRIAPQSTRIEDGVVVVHYAERKPGEDFSVQPSVNMSMNFIVKDGELLEMILPSQIKSFSWKWVRTQMNDGTVITPKQPGVFTLTLGEDGKVTGTTDCNNFFGSYTLQDNQLSFGPLASTKMYCEGSQESEFLKYLTEVQSYLVVDNQLVLEIQYDSGQLIFE